MSGDTVGLYFYLINGASNLSYQSGVSVNSRSDGQLEIITGSGVSAGFSATFYPRDINAQMFYHHGSRPQGDCSTGRIPVEAVVSIPQVSLPADTIIDVNGSIALDAGAGFVQYAWSTGATTQTLTLTGAQLGNGIHIVTVSVTDANGCTASDDIIVGVANLVGIEARSALAWQLSPNPARDVLQIEWLGQEDAGQLQLRDALGNIVFETQLEAFVGAYQMSLQDFAGGVYFVEWRTEDVVLRKKVLVVK